jgi:uncharacterized phiE125 gp8 family phage protein
MAVTRETVKKFLGKTDSCDDDFVDLMIRAATERCEARTNRQLITATWQLTLDRFPVGNFIYLPKPPIQSVTTINYTDSADVVQTFTDWTLDVEKEPGEVYRTESWPAPKDIPSAVKITYVSGYGLDETDIPEELVIAICLAARHYYDQRDEVITGTIVARMPQTTESIFESFSYGDEFVCYG